MRRFAIALLVSLLLACLVVPTVGAAPAAAASAPVVPKVVVIVGPSGAATDRYRSEAIKAAALARKYTPDVTELYSPNATWPAVKRALQGASLVIYMGHGNGWPSRYRDSLYPPTQNGFGLNPSAGSGDSTHQYFGEGPIAKSIRLADDAVVLLNHLCYASGNTEPGLAEGTLAQARQRVDNFAAGFIKAGAAAVVAEAYTSPNYMIKSILGGTRGIDAAWRNAPSRNGNAFAFDSVRSPGYIAQMDPERLWSRFSRSIVLKAGLAPADVRKGARGSAAAASVRIDAALLAPSLLSAGVTTKAPTLGSTTADTTITFKVPYKVKERAALPKTIMASVRWDALDPIAPDPTSEAAAAGAASVSDPEAAPDLGLVSAERLGDVVSPAKMKIAKKSLSLKVATPTAPGRYRLTVTLHDKDGVAYDPSTQALLPTLIVRITGDLDAQIVAPAATELAPGRAARLDLWVANLGIAPWGRLAFYDPIDPQGSSPALSAKLTAQWVALGGENDPDALASAAAAAAAPVTLPAGMAPGDIVPAALDLFAPTVEGDYLLILDILSPENGSLVAAGIEPTIIRVKVAKPTADPAAGANARRPDAPVPQETAGAEDGAPSDAAAESAAPTASAAPSASAPAAPGSVAPDDAPISVR